MSNYGPKNMNLYDVNSNLRRKESRTTDEIGWASNNAVQTYSGKNSVVPNYKQLERETAKYARLNKKQPVISLKDLKAQYGDDSIEVRNFLGQLGKVA